MKKSRIALMALLAALGSCAGASSGQGSRSINSREVETSPAPTSEEIRKAWSAYMNDPHNMPSEVAVIDIDRDGAPEYIYAKRPQQMIMVCTFSTSGRLKLAAASCHEQKDFAICDGAGAMEAIYTTEYQETRYSVLDGSVLSGVFYEILSREGRGPGKCQYSAEPRGVRKDITHAEFETKTSGFAAAPSLPLDNLEWKPCRL